MKKMLLPEAGARNAVWDASIMPTRACDTLRAHPRRFTDAARMF
jgi:hypothetical protein